MSATNPSAGEDLEVLIVEDEPRLRDVLQRAIPDMGLRAASARSAEEALRLMQERPRPIIVLDLNLPGMHGLTFFEKVREQWPATQVVILTGFGDLEAARQAIRLEVADFLTKPCSLGDLERSLDRARRRIAKPEDKPALRPGAVRPQTGESDGEDAPDQPGPTASVVEDDGPRKLQDIERMHILAALDRHHGNRTAAAAELGISVRTLYYRLAEYQRRGLMPRD